MQFNLIDWCHKHTHVRPRRNGPVRSLLEASSSRKGELEVRAYSWSFPPRAVFDDPVWQDSNPPHNAAPSPGRRSSRDRLTGTQATREDALLAGPQEGDDWLQKTTRRPKTRRQLSTLSRLAHARFSYPTLALPHWAERTLYAHIWSQARTKRMCPYLGEART